MAELLKDDDFSDHVVQMDIHVQDEVGDLALCDGLIAYQKGYGEGYVHKNIVRDISDGGMFGNGDIPLAEGGQTEKTFSLTVQDGAYDVSDLSLVIYSLCNEDGNIVSDNSIRVPVGESTDYRYDD